MRLDASHMASPIDLRVLRCARRACILPRVRSRGKYVSPSFVSFVCLSVCLLVARATWGSNERFSTKNQTRRVGFFFFFSSSFFLFIILFARGGFDGGYAVIPESMREQFDNC